MRPPCFSSRVPGNRSIAQLAGRVEPMRSTPVVEGDDGVRVEPAPAPAPSSQSAAVLPKEIWRLVDFIYTRGIDMPGLFIAPGDEVGGSWPGGGPGSAVISGVGVVIDGCWICLVLLEVVCSLVVLLFGAGVMGV